MHTTKSTRNTSVKFIESTNNWKKNTPNYASNSLRTIVPVANAIERRRTIRTKPKSTMVCKHQRPSVRSSRDRRKIIVSSTRERRSRKSFFASSAFIISDIDESQNLDQTVRRFRSKSSEETVRGEKKTFVFQEHLTTTTMTKKNKKLKPTDEPKWREEEMTVMMMTKRKKMRATTVPWMKPKPKKMTIPMGPTRKKVNDVKHLQLIS